MGISVKELTGRYPTLYHMASYGSWPTIMKHGLLSTSSLLDLFEIGDPRKSQLIATQRKQSVQIFHPMHGTATLRDQKPLSASSLARCLKDCDPPSWYQILNERVFFWLDAKRLETLMSASEYAGKLHTVLYIESAPLVADYENQIELAHMNTGNTRPFAHPRGKATFRQLDQYPYEDRRRLTDYGAVVELTVMGGVPNLAKYVVRAEHATRVNGQYSVTEVLYQR